MNQAMFFNVLLGNRQRTGGDIHRVHFRFREGIGAGNRDAAAAGTHIQYMMGWRADQTGKAVLNQFANR